MTNDLASNDEPTLVDLLDRVLAKGVVLAGKIRLSVADVDLVNLDLKILLAGTATMGPRPERDINSLHDRAGRRHVSQRTHPGS